MDNRAEYVVRVKAWPPVYVHVPWQRVTAVHTAVKGLGHGFFVYVDDPEALVAGDPAAVRRLRRSMRRFLGAPFVYPVSGRAGRVAEIDAAIRWFIGGRLGLPGQTPVG